MANERNEMSQQMRETAQKSLDQARKAVDEVMSAAQRTAATVEGSAQALQQSAAEMNRKAVGFTEANVEAAFAFADRLVKAQNTQDIASIGQEFIRSQVEAFNQQMRELGDAAKGKGAQPKRK